MLLIILGGVEEEDPRDQVVEEPHSGGADCRGQERVAVAEAVRRSRRNRLSRR
jgi:hypothetical protein